MNEATALILRDSRA